jgi:Tol biopolymer transport system component/predicted Ser/Thr protein kinase
MPLSPGDKLGPYEILAPIGAGGMGEVYKARDARLKRDVAIKVSAAQFSERFEREAQAIAALNHPNICHLYDVGPNYLVMELIEGTPIKGPLLVDQALKYAAQICDALDAAHAKGITHRDLKPANILITKQGIKLLDFGLAKVGPAVQVEDATRTMALTGKGEILGTLFYMSPEQLNQQEADARSDIFSFGLVLYEMLTGKRAFDGKSQASVIAAILERPAPSVSDVAPPMLERVLRRCLEKDPENRWQSARDLKAALELVGPALPETGAPQAPQRLPWYLVAIAALAVLAVGLVALVWLRRPTAVAGPRVKVTLEVPLDQGWARPAFSPDGTRIAFATREGIVVRAIDSLDTLPIKTSSHPTVVGWSPDGQWLVYHGSGELSKVSASGGAPYTLVTTGSSTSRGVSWSTDGTILFSVGGPIMRVSENGGTPAPVTDAPGRYPALLPDKRHFLFLGGRDLTADGAIYAGSLDSRDIRKITAANSKAEFTSSGHLLFMRGTTLVAQPFDAAGLRTTGDAFPVAADVGLFAVARDGYFSASRGFIVYRTGGVGRNGLTWFDRSGKPSRAVDDAFYNDIEIAPDGKAFAASRVDPKTLLSTVWITDLVRGTTSRLSQDGEDASAPSWSPDGKRIVYASGDGRLFLKDATGSSERELLVPQGTFPHWSPDGKTLVYTLEMPGKLMLVSLGGERRPTLYLDGQFAQPAFSPDGRWMAYVSNQSGRFEVFVQPVPAGHGKWQVSTKGGFQPIWRQDGKELFYWSGDNKIVVVPVKTSAQFEAGVPKELFSVSTTGLGLGQIRRAYSVSPDGQRFLVVQGEQQQTQVILLENWLSLAH